jgi:hypothetical protein
LVVNLSLIYDPSTRRLIITEDRMNGNGTGDPGFGTHAVLSEFMIYPALQSYALGIHPSPA